jgi:hypothetical protein
MRLKIYSWIERIKRILSLSVTRHCVGVYGEELRQTTRSLSNDSRYSSPDSNRVLLSRSPKLYRGADVLDNIVLFTTLRNTLYCSENFMRKSASPSMFVSSPHIMISYSQDKRSGILSVYLRCLVLYWLNVTAGFSVAFRMRSSKGIACPVHKYQGYMERGGKAPRTLSRFIHRNGCSVSRFEIFTQGEKKARFPLDMNLCRETILRWTCSVRPWMWKEAVRVTLSYCPSISWGTEEDHEMV